MSLAWLVPGQDWVTPLPAGWALLAGHRQAHWAWDVLDLDGRLLGTLDGVGGGSIDLNIHADTRATGSLTWRGEPGDQPDWNVVRLRPRYELTLGDGTALDWTMGVYLPATSPVKYGSAGLVVGVDFYDKTLILREDLVDQTWSIAAGAHIIPAVRALVEQSVGGQVIIEDSSATVRSGLAWPVGTSKLRIVNDLLEAAGFWAIWADGDGVMRSEAHTEPGARPLEWAFRRGRDALHTPDYTTVKDTFKAPNRVVLTTAGDEETPGLRAVQTVDTLSPGHPLSYAVRRRWITRHDEVEASSQTVLQEMTNRLAWNAIEAHETLELTHAPLLLSMNGRASFDSEHLSLDLVVQKMHIKCTSTALWTTTGRRIIL